MEPPAIQVSLFEGPIAQIYEKVDEIKVLKKTISDAEKDYPEDIVSLEKKSKDLQAQVKEGKDEHVESLKEDKGYNETNSMLSLAKEALALAKEALKDSVHDHLDEFGTIDGDVTVEGTTHRLNVTNEKGFYLDGKDLEKF